jgi:hypothetical protein
MAVTFTDLDLLAAVRIELLAEYTFMPPDSGNTSTVET